MAVEMEKAGLFFKQQCDIEVLYDGVVIGRYVADFVVEDVVIVELKAVPVLTDGHEGQLLKYLRATGLEVGLVINFGDKFEIRRKVYEKSKRERDSWKDTVPGTLKGPLIAGRSTEGTVAPPRLERDGWMKRRERLWGF